MIPIDDLLYDIEMKLNKVATNRHQDIPIEDRIIALNQAQIQLIKQKLGQNNIYKLGIDSFNKRFDDFRDLIPPDKELSFSYSNNDIYVAPIPNSLSYMFFIGCYILANKDTCTNRVLDVNGPIAHADTREWMRNTNLCPSFEYQETFATLSSVGIEVYTDGTFEPTILYLRYLRYPINVDKSGYIHFDNTSSTDVNSELPAYLRDELVDLAVKELAAMTENQSAYQTTNDRIANNE